MTSSPLPRIWGDVPPRNPNFTGRDMILARLRPATGPVALYGVQGVGKTQIALEHVYRNRGEYEIVWWVDAGHPERIAASFQRLAAVLGVPTFPSAVRGALSAYPHLLVLDGARSLDQVPPYLPTAPIGPVLL